MLQNIQDVIKRGYTLSLFTNDHVTKIFKKNETTYRYENVQKVLQSWQLRNELLDDFTEGLEYGVVIDTG